MAKTKEVTFQKKSSFQKPDCLPNKPGCLGDSTLEAVCGNALIRCCEKEECKDEARRMAERTTTV